MFDLSLAVEKDDRIDRIYKLFDKPSVTPRPKMDRKRIYSGATNHLLDDVMIYRDEKLIAVRWDTINPKPDFAKGISFYLPEDKIKISTLYHEDGKFAKHYCEVVEVEKTKDNGKDLYIFRDLIVDVNVSEDMKFEVVDLDELQIAVENGTVTIEKAAEIIKVKNKILNLIEADEIPPKECIRKVENSK